ncbi:bacteriorhodopsin [Pontibacillus salipaludis]|uniref:bacteriorhodopsin n=1 Tax=Pontibacillus salipaludis TaxID=1697394 RepID=UPI0031F091FF
MSSFVTGMHWAYFAIMMIGAIYFYFLSRNPQGVPSYEYVLAITIPAWSGVAYLSIALGQGLLEEAEKTIYFARYLDWVITTPLLLLALGLTAMIEHKKKNIALLFSLVVADVFMILTGLIADFSDGAVKYIWYVLGVLALCLILYIIWYPLKRMADHTGEELSRHYKRIALYLTVFWVLYPTAWILGSSGLDVTQETMEILAFIILPIFSKIGFSILDLYGLRRLHLKQL